MAETEGNLVVELVKDDSPPMEPRELMLKWDLSYKELSQILRAPVTTVKKWVLAPSSSNHVEPKDSIKELCKCKDQILSALLETATQLKCTSTEFKVAERMYQRRNPR